MKLTLFQYPHLTVTLELPSSCFIHDVVLKAILSRKQTAHTGAHFDEDRDFPST